MLYGNYSSGFQVVVIGQIVNLLTFCFAGTFYFEKAAAKTLV